jgi:hypothetical protein
MITLIPLEDNFTIYQLSGYEKIPAQIFESGFYSITRTADEISVVTNCKEIFDDLNSSLGWKGFKVEGILDFSLVGIINEITRPLKDNKISVFVISTFNTDYVLVKDESFLRAIDIFKMTDSIKVKD